MTIALVAAAAAWCAFWCGFGFGRQRGRAENPPLELRDQDNVVVELALTMLGDQAIV